MHALLHLNDVVCNQWDEGVMPTSTRFNLTVQFLDIFQWTVNELFENCRELGRRLVYDETL